MSNSVPQIFSFNNNDIRTVLISNEPWWVAADVCSALDIVDVSKSVTRLNPKGVLETRTLTKGGSQVMTIINEPNLYRLVLRSNKPMAEAFQDWIVEEVIPSIYKTGVYQVNSTASIDFRSIVSDPELLSTTIASLEADQVSIGEDLALLKSLEARMYSGHTARRSPKLDVTVPSIECHLKDFIAEKCTIDPCA